MSDVLSTIIVILVMIFLGYFLKRINLLNIKDIDVLNKIAINVAMPCLIFSSLYGVDLSNISDLGILPIISLSVGAISGLIVFTILKMKGFSKKRLWGAVIPVAIGNTAFLGFPMVLGVFGQTGLLRAIFYDMGTLIMFLSLSVILMINFGGTLKDVIKRILSFPVLWAVILGICFNMLNIPIGVIANNVIGYLAAAAIPIIMISLGLSLQFKGLKKNLKFAGLDVIVKLLIAPIIAFILVTLVGLSNMEYIIAIIESAMPSGMLTLILAVNYKLDFNIAADCVIFTTIFSLITFPIVIGILSMIRTNS